MEELTQNKNWSGFEKIIFRFFFVYVLLFINSFSFEHSFIPDIGKYTSPFFEFLADFTAKNILSLQKPYVVKLISDSAGMYVNALNLIFISLLISGIWFWFDRKRAGYTVLSYWFFAFIRYYLALQLFEYGFNKIFKWQFYLPEPNTLFTTIGETPRDLLYWSTMGVSRPYVVCMGVAEVLAGSLLLFRRTTLTGALLSFIILINVLLINLCYDISVKLYSSFLLLLCVILIVPHFKKIFNFFLQKKNDEDSTEKLFCCPAKNKWIYRTVKCLFILIILTDTSFRYFSSGNLNDDKAPRPFLHGAYNVELFIRNNDTLPPLLTDKNRWRRFFIHRQGFFIFQKMNDEMNDFNLNYDLINKKLIIDSSRVTLDYNLINDSMVVLSGEIKGNSLKVIGKKINLKKLWLLQEEFEWTVHE